MSAEQHTTLPRASRALPIAVLVDDDGYVHTPRVEHATADLEGSSFTLLANVSMFNPWWRPPEQLAVHLAKLYLKESTGLDFAGEHLVKGCGSLDADHVTGAIRVHAMTAAGTLFIEWKVVPDAHWSDLVRDQELREQLQSEYPTA